MKNMKKGIFLIVLVLVTLAGSLIGCNQPASSTPADTSSLPGDTSADENNVQTIRFGYFPISNLLPVYVAQEKGFFNDNGLKVEMTEIPSSPEIMTAMGADQLDAGSMSFITTVLSRQQGVPVKIVASFGYSKVGQALNGLYVLADSSITTVEGLSGGKIGGAYKGTEPWFWIMDTLDSNGVTDYTYVELRTPDIPSTLMAGTIDAACLQEPQKTMMSGKVKMLADLGNITGACGYAFTEKSINENPETVKHWVDSLETAIKFIRENNEKAREILSKYTYVPAEIAQAATLPSWDDRSRILIDEAEREVEWMKKYGLINAAPDLSDVFDYEITGTVSLKELGK
jgi:NitT/TauT family transport system substrate-binding protein